MNRFTGIFSGRLAARLLVLCVALCVLSACGQKSRLKATVEAVNNECPISMGSLGEMRSIAYDGENVVISLLVDENMMNFEALKKNPDVVKSSLVAGLRNQSDDFNAMLKQSIDAGAGWKYIYKGKESGEEVTFHLLIGDLNAALNTDMTKEESDLAHLKEMVDYTNLSFPMQIDEVTVVERLSLEKDYVVYDYTVDESQVDFGTILQNKEEVKNMLKETLGSGDMSVKAFVECCLKCGRAIHYRYNGNTSGKQFLITFSVDELKAL